MERLDTWLSRLGLAHYAPLFAARDIDLGRIGGLCEADFKQIGITSLGHRRKLLQAAAQLNAAAAPGPTSPSTSAAPMARATEAERRQLTVLFCELVDSTALSARLDPEDMLEIVRVYQDACAHVIGRYEGFVAQFLGDGVMAYFGYPHAHEDDAERAVRAGLDLNAALRNLETKASISARIGIATGLVVVGDLIGEGAAKERAVVGETPNLAARLQGLAAPGTIVVSAATRRLLGSTFALRDLGCLPIKGLEAPAQAFAAEGLRSFASRFEARAGRLTGFVGRREEGERLLELQQLAWQGRGRVVLLSGEAGIGKSRLAMWVADTMGAEPHTRLRYQCTPHHTSSALYPTIAQIERAAGIEPNDPAEAKLAKLEAVFALAKLDAAETVPLFASLLSIPTGQKWPPLAMTPHEQRRRTMAAMLDQIAALAEQKPVLMIYEDAHWADATSLELLDALVDFVARSPVFCLVTGRPEFSPAWSGRDNVFPLMLEKMDERQARCIAENVAGGIELPSDVLDHIVAKSDGIPLFVEELTKAIIESHLSSGDATRGKRVLSPARFATPTTLQDSLLARLGRSHEAKEIAQLGAAIGREFSYKLLSAIADMDDTALRAGLADLQDRQLANRRGVAPDAIYTFKHALVQDAAYDCLLKSRRRTIHRRIAAVLQADFPSVAKSQPETIAHHLTRAEDFRTAVEWWRKAGDLALRRSAYLESKTHFETAIELADDLPEEPALRSLRLRMRVSCGNALMSAFGWGAPETVVAFSRIAEIATEPDEAAERFGACFGLWVGCHARGEVLSARRFGEKCLSEAHNLQSERYITGAKQLIGVTDWCSGAYARAAEPLEAAWKAYDFERDAPAAYAFGQDAGASALYILALIYWPLGNIERAAVVAAQALDHAERTRHTVTLANVHLHLAFLETMRGRHDRVAVHVGALADLSRKHGMAIWSAYSDLLGGWVQWCAGGRQAGEKAMTSGQGFLTGRGESLAQPLFATLWADVRRSESADGELRVLDEALSATGNKGLRWFDAELHRRRGAALLQCGRGYASQGEAALMEARAIARDQRARTFELRASLDLARLYCDTGREREAREVLGPALVGFSETPELPEIGEAKQLLASLC